MRGGPRFCPEKCPQFAPKLCCKHRRTAQREARKKLLKPCGSRSFFGDPAGIRTRDTLLKRQLLEFLISVDITDFLRFIICVLPPILPRKGILNCTNQLLRAIADDMAVHIERHLNGGVPG